MIFCNAFSIALGIQFGPQVGANSGSNWLPEPRQNSSQNDTEKNGYQEVMHHGLSHPNVKQAKSVSSYKNN